MRIALLALLVGCSAPTKRCKENTLFVSVTLQGEAANADQIVVDVAVDGGTPVHTALAHTAGRGMGGIEIEFPNGYPKDHSVKVTLTATANAAVVGAASDSVTLGGGCDALTLVVSSTTAADLSSIDLAGADFEGVDLAEVDLAGVDLEGVDLATAPDLAPQDLNGADLVCVPTNEDCFNNGDDDCDGLVDCADSDCTGGGSPVAVCAPDPGAFQIGTKIASGGCPSSYPNSTPIGSDFVAGGCDTGTCACPTGSDVFGRCSAFIYKYSNTDTMCMMGGTFNGATDNIAGGCANTSPPVPNGAYHKIESQWSAGGCNPSGGSAAKIDAKFNNNEKFCRPAQVGGGCTNGAVCVPKPPGKSCVMAGSGVCPSQYVATAKQYYLSINDNRTCGCFCTYTNGACPSPTLYTGVGCGGSVVAFVQRGCANDDMSGVLSFSVAFETTHGSCGSPFALETGGGASPQSPQVVCCLP